MGCTMRSMWRRRRAGCRTDPAASGREHRWRVLGRGRGLFVIEVGSDDRDDVDVG